MFNTPEGRRIIKFSSIVLVILSVFLVFATLYVIRATARVGYSSPATNVISVSGEGEVLATPDIAVFTVGVLETSESVASAQKVVTDKVNKVLEALKKAGVEDKDIKTVGYNIYPHYEYTQDICTSLSCRPGQQKLTGYEVSQNIEVKVRDTEKAPTILSDLGALEVTNISGLSFTFDNDDAVKTEAREKAIADARDKAKKLAKDLGVRLGKIVSYNENSYGYPVPMYDVYGGKGGMAMEQSASAPDVPVGQNTISSSVSITYEIH